MELGGKHYRFEGKEIFVAEGLALNYFGTYWGHGPLYHRISSPALPIRNSRNAAQNDLDAWAEELALEEVAS